MHGTRQSGDMELSGPNRLHLSPGLWRAVERELAYTLPTITLPANSALAQALVPRENRRSAALRYFWRSPMDGRSGLNSRHDLDGLIAGCNNPAPR